MKTIEIPLTDKQRKKKLLDSSIFGKFLNWIGRRKDFVDCPGCGDSFWWKRDIDIAFRKPQAYTDADNRFVQTDVTYSCGAMICWECFIEKSESELARVFDKVKMQWIEQCSDPDKKEKIFEYKLLHPIRTTRGIFKKEMLKIPKNLGR